MKNEGPLQSRACMQIVVQTRGENDVVLIGLRARFADSRRDYAGARQQLAPHSKPGTIIFPRTHVILAPAKILGFPARD
jgi:hypothetical protein